MSELNSIDSSLSVGLPLQYDPKLHSTATGDGHGSFSLGRSAPAASLTSSQGLSGPREGPWESENTPVHYSD